MKNNNNYLLNIYAYSNVFECSELIESHPTPIIYLVKSDILFNQSSPFNNGNHKYSGNYMSLYAGSIAGFIRWKSMLCKMIGWDMEKLTDYVCKVYHRDDIIKNVINDKSDFEIDIPFIELILFSNDEGFIGSKVSKKLYNDFVEWEERAIIFNETSSKTGQWMGLYSDLKNIFEISSNSGVVIFNPDDVFN